MTQPFDGADATPDDDATDPPTPARPALIDLASALLIVGGITALVGWPLALILGALATGSGIQLFGSLISIVFLAMNAVAIATGVLIRRGRRWRLCINIVAISILLYLTEISRPIAMFYLAMDVVVFYALIQHRGWFEGKAAPSPDAP